MTDEPVLLLVQLWAHLDQGDELRAIEDELVALVAKHGGEVTERHRAVPLEGFSGDSVPPDEVHVVRFPSRQAMQAYVDDPERAEVTARLPAVLAARTVWTLEDLAGR